MKHFLMDLFRFMKSYPVATDENWKEISDISNKIYEKYHYHSIVKKFLLAYTDFLEEEYRKKKNKK